MMIVLVAALLGGCQGGKEDNVEYQQKLEKRAAVARAHVDDLAERLEGVGVRVVGDDFIPCDPQDTSSDPEMFLNYTLRFTVDDGAVDRLQGEIAEALENDGWTVRRDAFNADSGEASVRFLRDGFSMGSKISTKTGNATAGGSSGCVEK